MWRGVLFGTCLAALLRATPAPAAAPGYAEAKTAFDDGFTTPQRLQLQLLLIAGGYSNGVPIEHMNTRVFDGLRSFETSNGFPANGRLDNAQISRLLAEGGAKLSLWGFRKVTHPVRPVAIWVPLGLGLTATADAVGLHYKDPQGRLGLAFLSLQNRTIADIYRGLTTERQRDGSTIRYSVDRTGDGWFVLSTSSTDGHDHYYRYHQDGSAVTGFALEWDNAAGNINAERIAVIISGSLWSAMTGAPFIDPPQPQTVAVAAAAAEPMTGRSAVVTNPLPAAPRPAGTAGHEATGVFVSANGHLVTNARAVSGCSKILVRTEGGAVADGDLIASDTSIDVALLKIDATPVQAVAFASAAHLGDDVAAFGLSRFDAPSGGLRPGILTSVNAGSRFVRLAAPVQAGDTGGPVLDRSGNLVGILNAPQAEASVVSASDDGRPASSLAVKASMVAAFLYANRVDYQSGSSGRMLEPSELAARARKMSAQVTCR